MLDLSDAETLYQLALAFGAMALMTLTSAYLFTLGSGHATDVADPDADRRRPMG
jgi:hypothetical protein